MRCFKCGKTWDVSTEQYVVLWDHIYAMRKVLLREGVPVRRRWPGLSVLNFLVDCCEGIPTEAKIMNRAQAINIIEGLYPTDSQYPDVNAVGERLLAQAKRECEDWRDLPDNILIQYAELCEAEENKRIRGELK